MDPVDITAQEALAKKRAVAERARAERSRQTLRRVMSSDFGREFVLAILEDAGVFLPVVDIERPEETHRTAFRDGMRQTGLRLFTEIHTHFPETWTTMIREGAERRALQQRADEEEDE